MGDREFGRFEQAVFHCEPERRSGGVQCAPGVQRCGEGCAALKAATTLRVVGAAKLICQQDSSAKLYRSLPVESYFLKKRQAFDAILSLPTIYVFSSLRG